jgi:hypothetical protein
MPFCFKDSCQFTQRLHFHCLIFGLTPFASTFGWCTQNETWRLPVDCKLNTRHCVCAVQFRPYGLFAFVFFSYLFYQTTWSHWDWGVEGLRWMMAAGTWMVVIWLICGWWSNKPSTYKLGWNKKTARMHGRTTNLTIIPTIIWHDWRPNLTAARILMVLIKELNCNGC